MLLLTQYIRTSHLVITAHKIVHMISYRCLYRAVKNLRDYMNMNSEEGVLRFKGT